MRRALRAVIFLGAICLAQTATQTLAPLLHPDPPDANYHPPVDKTLSYAADWRLFSAGNATLRLENARGEHRVLGTADATGFAALLYHIHDRFEAFVDPRANCTLSLTKHTEEGFRRIETQITYEQARRKSVLEEKNLKNGTTKRQENDTPGCVTDVLSGIFYLASQPLAANARYTFPLNDGGKTVSVTAIVEAREEIKVPAGTFKTVRVQPTAESGVVKNRGQIWIWFTDDTRHIPVQMKARMFFGTITLRLVSMP